MSSKRRRLLISREEWNFLAVALQRPEQYKRPTSQRFFPIVINQGALDLLNQYRHKITKDYRAKIDFEIDAKKGQGLIDVQEAAKASDG
jgi:hypothetical protein